jgi:hypothetical protein
MWKFSLYYCKSLLSISLLCPSGPGSACSTNGQECYYPVGFSSMSCDAQGMVIIYKCQP